MSIRAIKWAHSVLPLLDLPPTERMTLLVLAFHHNDKTGDCFPSIQTLRQKVGVGDRRQRKAVQALVDWRLIQKKRGASAEGNASNRYTLFGAPRRPKHTGTQGTVQSPAEPAQKSRFQTGTPGTASNRHTGDDDRGYHSKGEKAFAKGEVSVRLLTGGRNA